MYNKMSMIFNVVMYVFGIAVLVPAFVLVVQFGILGSVAKSETDAVETPLTIWLMLGTLFGGIAYLIALGALAWRPQTDCRWCLYCLTGYAIYVAVMIGYISSGDFTLQVRTSGLLSALSSNVQVLLYIAAPLVFVVLLIFSLRKAG